MGAKALEKFGINRTRRLQCHTVSHQMHKIKIIKRGLQLFQKCKTEIIKKRQLMLKNKMPVESTIMPDDERKKQNTNISNKRKIEFGCPKCSKMFPVYFSASRHIQKYHSVHSKGEKTSSNSTNQIKPIRYELCANCNKQIHLSQIHTCGSENLDELGSKTIYICLGCDQHYSTMHLFDLHLSTLHSTCVESLFLPTFNEFTNWKRQMELQTQAKYLILGNTNIKQTYRCTYELKDEMTDIIKLCPSSIVIQEFSKGIQVHYYKEHHGHSCDDYKLFDKFKKFSITNLMKNAELYMDMGDVKSDENDLYLQFKKLMSCIIFDAAKINITTLKVLHGKALEMTSILNNYDEDEDVLNSVTSCESRIVLTPKSNVKMSDDQITNELEGTRSSQRIKRRIHNTLDPKEVKKIKIDEKEPSANDKHHSRNPAEDDETNSEIQEDETYELSTQKPDTETMNHGSPKVDTKPKPMIQSPSSFNDSYKNFVDTTFKIISDKTSTPLRRTRNSCNTTKDIKKKVIVKTKMGQFIPTNSPKKVQESTYIKDNHNSNIEEDSMSDSASKSNILKIKLTSTSNILKAKPAVDKLKPQNSKATRKTSLLKAKSLPDIKYEVKEQENDCNILILKI